MDWGKVTTNITTIRISKKRIIDLLIDCDTSLLLYLHILIVKYSNPIRKFIATSILNQI